MRPSSWAESPTYTGVLAAWQALPRQSAFSLRFQVQAIRALAEGEAVSPTRLAASLGISAGEVEALFRRLAETGAEVDAEGRLEGLVLTLRPTPHRMRVDGKTLFAWCALDTLFLPAYLEAPADVASSCPVTGEPVHLTVPPSGSVLSRPSSVRVSIVDPRRVCCTGRGLRGNVCSQMHFFASPEAAAAWQAGHPDVALCTLEEAARLARLLVERGVALDPLA